MSLRDSRERIEYAHKYTHLDTKELYPEILIVP